MKQKVNIIVEKVENEMIMNVRNIISNAQNQIWSSPNFLKMIILIL